MLSLNLVFGKAFKWYILQKGDGSEPLSYKCYRQSMKTGIQKIAFTFSPKYYINKLSKSNHSLCLAAMNTELYSLLAVILYNAYE